MSVPELHPAIGRNKFCGPGALAILTGRPSDETAKAIREVSGKVNVFSVSPRLIRKAAAALGLDLDRVYDAPPTRKGRQLLENFAPGLDPGRYLVAVTGHYVVVRVAPDGAVEVADNQSVYPHPLARFPRRRKVVDIVWRV